MAARLTEREKFRRALSRAMGLAEYAAHIAWRARLAAAEVKSLAEAAPFAGGDEVDGFVSQQALAAEERARNVAAVASGASGKLRGLVRLVGADRP